MKTTKDTLPVNKQRTDVQDGAQTMGSEILAQILRHKYAILNNRLRAYGGEVADAFEGICGQIDIDEMGQIDLGLWMVGVMDETNLDNVQLIKAMFGAAEQCDGDCEQFKAAFEKFIKVETNLDATLLTYKFFERYEFGPETIEHYEGDMKKMECEMADALECFELDYVERLEVADAIDVFLEEVPEGTDLDEEFGAWNLGFAQFIVGKLVEPRLAALPIGFENVYDHVLKQLAEPAEIRDYTYAALKLLKKLNEMVEMEEIDAEDLEKVCGLAEKCEANPDWFFDELERGDYEDDDCDEDDACEDDDVNVLDLLDWKMYEDE